MKLLFDFFPIILFFIAYKLEGIFVATAVAIAASFLQVAYHRWHRGRFETMHLATLGLIVVFGGATLVLEDKQFIMWKPSVVNWLFGIAFLGSQFIGDRPLIQRMMGAMVQLAPPVWRRLNLAWVVFFVAVGLANLYVANLFFEADAALQAATGAALGDVTDDAGCAQQYSGEVVQLCQAAHDREENWVNFKLFGLLGLTVAFVLLQAFYMARHMSQDEPEKSAQTEKTLMLYMIVAEDVPESLQRRISARPRHVQRLNALKDAGRLLVAGPNPAIDSPDPGPAGFTGSLILAEFESQEQARAWADADPYVEAGVYAAVTVKPFKKVLP